MKNVHVQRYSDVNKQLWDDFVSQAEVHSILFYRDFIEYHSDRFTDYSLMFFQENKLIAIMPANIDADNIIHSHQGLSYGGLLFKPFTSFQIRLKAYLFILQFLETHNVYDLRLKEIPSCYANGGSNRLIFQWLSVTCVRTDIYSYIPKAAYKKPNRNRLRYLEKINNTNVEVRSTESYLEFWENILIPNLKKRFDVSPVHTVAEIGGLANHFNKQIRLYGVYEGGSIRAGVVLFIHRDVVHAQYSAGDDGRSDGTLDYLLDFVIRKYNTSKTFSFGTSSEDVGERLNGGLLYWKESFRTVNDVQQFYHIKTVNHTKLIDRIR